MSELEAQFAPAPGDFLDTLAVEQRGKLLASNDMVTEHIAANEGIAQSVRNVLGLWQQVWLERVTRIPDPTSDARIEKREEDFHRAVAFGLDLAAKHLTDDATLRDLGSRLTAEKE